MRFQGRLSGVLMSVGFLLATVLTAEAQESKQPKNLLGNAGFENVPDSFLQEGMVVNQSETKWGFIGGWSCRGYQGKVKLTSDKAQKSEGKRSLKMEVAGGPMARFSLIQGNLRVKPNTVYELRLHVKPYNVNWVMSRAEFYFFYKKDGASERAGGGNRRMVNYSASPQFKEEVRRIVTGPKAETLEIYLTWQLEKKKDAILEKPAMVWLDDLKLVEVGPPCPASGQYLTEDFEKDLSNWILTDPGDGAKNNPKISDENAHNGKQSLKLSGAWGEVERVFRQDVSDCVVSVWFHDDSARPQHRMIMLTDADGKEIGLGVHSHSATHYTLYVAGEPRIEKAISVERTTGWHEFKWDFTKGKGCVFYVDGHKAGETDRVDSFRTVSLGSNAWRGFTCYVDDFKIDFKK